MPRHGTLASLLSVLSLACGERPAEPAPQGSQPAAPSSSMVRVASAAPSAPAPVPPPPPPLATGLAAAVAAIAPGDPRGPGLELLRKERDAAKGTERALYDRVVALAERMTAATDEAAIKANGAAWLKDYVAICRDIAKSAPDDAALQAEIAGSLFAIPALATGMGIDPKPFEGLRSEATALITAATKRLNDARPYASSASICQANGDDPLECMRLLAKCVSLEPKVPRCASELAKLKADYLRPHCEGADIHKDFAFFAAHANPTKPSAPPVAEAKPAFVAQDFASVQEIEQTFTSQEWDDKTKSFGPPIEKKSLALSIVLVAAKKADFAKWTEDLAAEKGSVSVRVGNTDVAKARVTSRIDGRMTISGAIDKVCAKASRRELPKDLVAK